MEGMPFILLAAEAGLLGHHADVERLARRQRVQQPGEPWPIGAEQRAGDPVVRVDVRVGDRPALLLRVRPRVRSAGDGLRVVGDAHLGGRPPGVEGCDHCASSFRVSVFKPSS